MIAPLAVRRFPAAFGWAVEAGGGAGAVGRAADAGGASEGGHHATRGWRARRGHQGQNTDSHREKNVTSFSGPPRSARPEKATSATGSPLSSGCRRSLQRSTGRLHVSAGEGAAMTPEDLPSLHVGGPIRTIPEHPLAARRPSVRKRSGAIHRPDQMAAERDHGKDTEYGNRDGDRTRNPQIPASSSIAVSILDQGG